MSVCAEEINHLVIEKDDEKNKLYKKIKELEEKIKLLEEKNNKLEKINKELQNKI